MIAASPELTAEMEDMGSILRTLALALAFLAAPVLAQENANDNPRVRLTTTMGEITIELFQEQAPKTVANFLSYVRSGFYDGTIFHRVIDDFVIQGGGFTPDMQPKPTGPTIENEADNGLSNRRGTLAMARARQPDSADSQFFINITDNPMLDHKAPTPRDWGYAVFGRVIAGMEVVDTIRKVATTRRGPYRDVPVQPVIIQQAIVTTDAPAGATGENPQ